MQRSKELNPDDIIMFLKQCLLLSFIYGISFHFCSAQLQLKGILISNQQDPIPYATVILLNKNSPGGVSSTHTDSTGHFFFRSVQPEEYSLSVYSIGFETQTIHFFLQKDSTITVILNPLHNTLKEVTVTGTKPVIERKPGKIIYDVANSIQSAGSNGLEALSQAPGIQINDHSISLAGRGLMSVMINGRLLHLSGRALTNYLKSFSVSQISKIEIITHPSAQYDAEGNAGLINIITKHSNKQNFSGEATGALSRFFYKDQPDYKGIQNYGDIQSGMQLDYNKNKWSLYTNISYTAGREIWGYGIGVKYPDKTWAMKDTGEYRISTLNIISGADYVLSPTTSIGVEYLYGHHVEDGADYVNVPVYNSEGQKDSLLKTYATYFPIAWTNSFNFHFIHNLSATGSKLTLNADYFNFYRFDRSDFETNTFINSDKPDTERRKEYYDTTLQNIRIYTFKADLELPVSFAKFNLGTKLSFINNYSNIYYYLKQNGNLILDNDLSNEFRYIENTQAFYGNGTKSLGKWDMEAGLRAEITQTKGISYLKSQKINRHYTKLFPSLLASYKMNDVHTLSLSYDKRIHRPTFWNLNPYKSMMTAYSYVEGNPYLEPEYITNIELSDIYKNRFTSSFYVQRINNGFAQVTLGNTDTFLIRTDMLNFIHTWQYGISESLSVQPFRWMESNNQINLYYTTVHSVLSYVKSERAPGAFIETDNTFFFNRNKTLAGSLGFRYQFPAIEQFGITDGYSNLSMGIRLTTLQKKLNISLTMNDLFRSSASTLHTTVNGLQNTFTNFQLNSHILLSASWNFGSTENRITPARTGNESERERAN